MKVFRNRLGGPRTRLKPRTWAALTLCIFNIYPMTVSALDVEVENIFDFDVPVGIITTGVVAAAVGATTEEWWSNRVAQLPQDIHDYYSVGVTDRTDWVTVAPYAQGFNTNNFSFSVSARPEGAPRDVSFFGFNTFGSVYQPAALGVATNSNSTNFLFRNSPIPWLNVPQLDTITAILQSPPTAPPEETPLSVADDVISSIGPSSSFFVTEITPEILASFDYGRLDALIDSMDRDGMFGYLPRAWPDVKTKIATILNDNKLAARRFIGPVACFVYVFMCFRWWLRRIFFVFEVFAGVGSGRDEPWSNDAEMKG